MRKTDHDRAAASNRLWSNVLLLSFGLALLAFLVGIERQNWFHIRPASGTAQAMSYAADRPLIDDTRAKTNWMKTN
ncbi:hypothetical protein [Sphingomonas jatrophae]|uniref:Uncharacterized protein n=1 Tax=Sphingomonas jatrophae TaxID=1166337 RepID=A0A1I6JZP4_9SPHN|nr:hypothetical protein [Sphingomonas jatrophae]SFR84426.1 hypothetical protein SAMN05192580_1134 [Sphingomonas jatrophae]